jgi:hypothetical protein
MCVALWFGAPMSNTAAADVIVEAPYTFGQWAHLAPSWNRFRCFVT